MHVTYYCLQVVFAVTIINIIAQESGYDYSKFLNQNDQKKKVHPLIAKSKIGDGRRRECDIDSR